VDVARELQRNAFFFGVPGDSTAEGKQNARLLRVKLGLGLTQNAAEDLWIGSFRIVDPDKLLAVTMQ